MNIAGCDAALDCKSRRHIQTFDLADLKIHVNRIVFFKSFCGEGNRFALAADLIIAVIADDEIRMDTDILVNVAGEDGIGRKIPQRISPNLGVVLLGVNMVWVQLLFRYSAVVLFRGILLL